MRTSFGLKTGLATFAIFIGIYAAFSIVRHVYLSEPSGSELHPIRTQKGSLLFQTLFNTSTGRAVDLSTAQERFQLPYQTRSFAHHLSDREQEIRDRIGILKALNLNPITSQTIKFYKTIVKDGAEDLLVRRQALENLKGRISEAERSEVLANLPPILISLAASSERELLEEIWEFKAKSRDLSQSSENISINNWEQLPCPSSEEFENYANQVKWTISDPFICDLSPQGKLSRALKLLAGIQLKHSIHFGTVGKNLQNPFAYLAMRSNRMVLNLKQKNSVAFNNTGIREINLGPDFFSGAPLDSLEVLIHEARHSDVGEDPKHETCVHGDIPGTLGGCDAILSDEADAGAYSYGAFFQFALSRQDGLTKADREFLETSALLTVFRRFNLHPPRLAHYQDLIAILTEEGSLRIVHPFTFQLLPTNNDPAKDRYTGMNYNDRNGGLFLFRKNKVSLDWQWGKPTENYFGGQLAVNSIQWSGKARIPLDNYTHSIFLENNKLHYVDNAESGPHKYVALPFPHQPEFLVREVFLGGRSNTYLLSSDGKIFKMGAWLNEPEYSIAENRNGPYRHAYGGVLRDSLFLISQDGKLYYQTQANPTPDYSDSADSFTPQLLLSSLQSEVPALKYPEGTSLQAILDQEGSLWVRNYGSLEKPQVINLPLKAKSFEIFRTLHTFSSNLNEKAFLEKHPRKCSLENAVRDPWLQLPVGLSNGILLFVTENGECVPGAFSDSIQGRIKSFSFKARNIRNDQKVSLYFHHVALNLELFTGEQIEVLPYKAL